MYLRMASFDVLTDLVDGGVINKTFAVIKNGNLQLIEVSGNLLVFKVFHGYRYCSLSAL